MHACNALHIHSYEPAAHSHLTLLVQLCFDKQANNYVKHADHAARITPLKRPTGWLDAQLNQASGKINSVHLVRIMPQHAQLYSMKKLYV